MGGGRWLAFVRIASCVIRCREVPRAVFPIVAGPVCSTDFVQVSSDVPISCHLQVPHWPMPCSARCRTSLTGLAQCRKRCVVWTAAQDRSLRICRRGYRGRCETATQTVAVGLAPFKVINSPLQQCSDSTEIQPMSLIRASAVSPPRAYRMVSPSALPSA